MECMNLVQIYRCLCDETRLRILHLLVDLHDLCELLLEPKRKLFQFAEYDHAVGQPAVHQRGQDVPAKVVRRVLVAAIFVEELEQRPRRKDIVPHGG